MKTIYKGKQQGNFTIENFRKVLLTKPGSAVIEEFHADGFFRLKIFLSDELVTIEYFYDNSSRQVKVNLFGNEKNFRKVGKYLV